MHDNASKRIAPGQRRSAGGEYELEFVRKYGLSVDQVEDLIQQYGHKRARLDAAVMRLPD